MGSQALSQPHDSPIININNPEYLCRLHDMAKRITQLKKSGNNFNIWERQLKVMIRSLTGSSTYLTPEVDQHNRKLNEVVFNLIFWSIDDDLQLDLNIDGSANDAFRVLSSHFSDLPSNSQNEGMTNGHRISEILQSEMILQNIVDIVHHQSRSESNIIRERELGRMEVHESPTFSGKGPAYKVYYDHRGPPILNTFQNLAVVNRMFHRLCLTKLWQKIQFPSALPAPMSLWTETILLKYDQCLDRKTYNFEENEKHCYDNTRLCAIPASSFWRKDVRYGIRSGNVKKILELCPYLESVVVKLPYDPLARVMKLHPQLQNLKLETQYNGPGDKFVISLLGELKTLVSLELSGFIFRKEGAIEESLGWNLAQQQELRKIRFEKVTFMDETWTLNTWLHRIETLELVSCSGLTIRILHEVLSGSAPSLTRLQLDLGYFLDGLEVNVRFDLPALKDLVLNSYTKLDLLLIFENCKDIELLKFGVGMKNQQWESMKQHLSKSTWPKLSTLSLCRPMVTIAKEEVDEIENAYNIKLLIDYNTSI
ncbi:hypothetical protein DFH28DRAFT_950831 [Melampsora americana]|nr:hypothetical protein DFH28DRAFT_950831 [Melampsora americana]